MTKLKKRLIKPNQHYPLVALPARNHRTPDETLSHPLLTDVMIDCKIFRANPMYYYRIAYFGISDLIADEVTITLQFDAISRHHYQSDAHREYLGEKKLSVKINQGVQKLKFKLQTSSGVNLKIKFQLDSDQLVNYIDCFFAAWRPKHKFYCWVIDPHNYHYYKHSQHQPILPNIIGQQTSSYSKDYYLDPLEELNTTLYGARSAPHGLIPRTILSQTYFEFANLSNSSGSIMSYPHSKHGFELLINRIITSTPHNPLNWSLFQPTAIQIGGIQQFKSTLELPLQALISGYIECMIRVTAPTDQEHYELFLVTEKNKHPFNSSPHEYLGMCHAAQLGPPIQLQRQDFLHNHYYSDHIYQEWLQGWWQKLYIPLHQLVDFHPQLNYHFFLKRHRAPQNHTTLLIPRAEDLIILGGYVSFQHDLAALLSSKDYQHLINSGNES